MGGDARLDRSVELSRREPGLFLQDVLEGLSQPRKSLPPKYFYDAAGSRLFERICRLREYYPTRVEVAITRKNLPRIRNLVDRWTKRRFGF